MSHEDDIPIHATVVPEHLRPEFLPKHFGLNATLKVEVSIFGWMESLCPAYKGGFWEFIELSNGGAYMRPAHADFYDLRVETNGFHAQVSADAAGLIATTMALNMLIWQGHKNLLSKYEQLRDFIPHHSEHPAILNALD
jgi:hypothetical protein